MSCTKRTHKFIFSFYKTEQKHEYCAYIIIQSQLCNDLFKRKKYNKVTNLNYSVFTDNYNCRINFYLSKAL